MLQILCVALLSTAAVTKTYPAKFVGCYDGDTCTFDLVLSDQTTDLGMDLEQHVVLTHRNQKIRLCDINAPEMKPGPNEPAIKAKNDLIAWITQAKQVSVQIAQKPNCVMPPAVSCDSYEKYGRLLGYIIADGVNLNEKQLTEKNAVPFIQCK